MDQKLAAARSATSASATRLTARSRALLQFCGIHMALLAAVMAGLHWRIVAGHGHGLGVLLLLAIAANGWNFWRQLRAARLQPAAAVVPRRVRMHLRLLAGVRGLLWIGLGAVMFGLSYLLIAGPPQQLPAIVTLLACPLVLAMKLRWLGAWERRLRDKADALAD